MKRTSFALIGATALALAACAGEADEEAAADNTLVDESYDESEASLDEAMEDMSDIEEPAVAEPAAPPADTEVDETDVMAEDPETDDVVGL